MILEMILKSKVNYFLLFKLVLLIYVDSYSPNKELYNDAVIMSSVWFVAGTE